MSFGSGGSGGGSIGSSSDVILSAPTAGQSLAFDSTALKWKNKSLTKSDVGLSNLDNTSDANKPISSAHQAALNALSAAIATKSQVVAIDHGAPDPDPAAYPDGTIFFEKAA